MTEIKFYELGLVTIKDEQSGFRFASAAIISCGLCGSMIDGMGGPGNGVVCIRCGDELRHGRLRSAVVWDEAAREETK